MNATSVASVFRLFARRPVVACQFLAVALAGNAIADTELPSAQSLLDAHIEATGGKESMNDQLESTVTGRFLMPAAGMEGQLTVYSRMPLERTVNIELPGIGSMQSGYKDRSAWSMDPFMGPRLVTGAELEVQIESNEPGALLRSDEFVESMRTVALAEFNGESCYKVEVKWKTGRETLDCYSVDNDYLIATESTMESPMGTMETTTVFTDYKTFTSNGIDMILPGTTLVTTMGQSQQVLIDSVELGAPDDDYFALPAAITTLLEDEQTEKAKAAN
ncbi:MAG: hypothetical protein AAF270_10470 [Pseudomonadota bacterium]